MGSGNELLAAMKQWVSDNKARLSQEGIDIAMTLGEASSQSDHRGASVTIYAQTQSPDLFDEASSTDGFVELTARVTAWESGDWYSEVLDADTAETILEESLSAVNVMKMAALLEDFIRQLEKRSFNP